MTSELTEEKKPGEKAVVKKKNPFPGGRVKVLKWSAVCQWRWSDVGDTCAICRNSLMEPSIMYLADPDAQSAEKGLQIAVGVCGHCFHLDCIEKWLITRQACPLCNKPWEFLNILPLRGRE